MTPESVSTASVDGTKLGLDQHSRLALVDGYAYIFRAYHALPALSRSRDGAPTGAVAGYCNMLFKLITTNGESGTIAKPTHIAVIFDAPGRTFRSKIYPQYKANRPPAPADLVPQFEFVRQATAAFSVPAFETEGFEADDIIATITASAVAQGASVDIYSGDKDLMQLVGGNVRMVDAMKNRVTSTAQVQEKFGVPPNLVGDALALAGDASDNIPGVAGIGIKTAASLLNEYGNLENLLEQAGNIKQQKRRESLIEQADMARLSRKLVTLRCDVPITPVNLSRSEFDPVVLGAYLADMELKHLEKRVNASLGKRGDISEASSQENKNDGYTATNASVDSVHNKVEQNSLFATPPKPVPSSLLIDATSGAYKAVTSQAGVTEIIDLARANGELSICVVCTCDDPMSSEVLGIALATASDSTAALGSAAYIPIKRSVDDDSVAADNGLLFDELSQILGPILRDDSIIKIGHNIKSDLVVLARFGLEVNSIDDTMLIALATSGANSSYTLESLAADFANYQMLDINDLLQGKNQSITDLPPDDIARYAGEKADITFRLWRLLKPRLISQRGTTQYETLEKPMTPVLVKMHLAGISINTEVLESLSREFAAEMVSLNDEITALAGKPFNLGSPAQIAEVLFGDLGLPGGRKTPGGKWSTDAKVLDDLAHSGHRIAKAIHQWRTLAKLKNTYTDVLPGFTNTKTNRVHTSYALAAVSTGRLSSSNPNLQNIPIRTANGRRIRHAFVSAPGHKLVSADYSQIELRILAHIAKETALSEAFARGEDIHAATAKALLGDPQADPDLRRRAKAINFGIIYGISAHGLAQQIGVSRTEAADFMKAYFERFPGIRTYMEQMPKQAAANAYVSTLFGRRIATSGILEANRVRRAFWERFAINAPIQGTAADLLRRAMIRISNLLEQQQFKARMLLQVHDELVFEAPDHEVEPLCKLVEKEMSHAASPAIEFTVPIEIDIGVADNWDDAH